MTTVARFESMKLAMVLHRRIPDAKDTSRLPGAAGALNSSRPGSRRAAGACATCDPGIDPDTDENVERRLSNPHRT